MVIEEVCSWKRAWKRYNPINLVDRTSSSGMRALGWRRCMNMSRLIRHRVHNSKTHGTTAVTPIEDWVSNAGQRYMYYVRKFCPIGRKAQSTFQQLSLRTISESLAFPSTVIKFLLWWKLTETELKRAASTLRWNSVLLLYRKSFLLTIFDD